MSQAKRTYRATFVLDTRGYQEPVETLVSKLKDTVKAIDGDVRRAESLGQRDFARVTDRRFPAGNYIQIDFDGPISAPVTIREKLRLDKTVNRILVQAI